jgi:hypothetical protein
MALATSKRKFYKLLDNLSSSKLPDQTLPSTPDRPIKRNRMLDARSRNDAGTGRPKTSVRAISSTFGSTVAASRGRAASTTTGTRHPAAYAPWSHDQFLERLKTFADVKTWSAKPDAVSEVVWAKRGWAVVGLDEVGCRSCGKHLVVKLDEQDDDHGTEPVTKESEDDKWWMDDADRKLVERYESLVSEGHDESCLWRKSGCKGRHCAREEEYATDC